MERPPNDTEIAVCLEHFRHIAPKIRQETAFGDSNRARIEAEIEVLANPTKWSTDVDYADDHGLDPEVDPGGILSRVRDAIYWINGEYDDCDGPYPESWDSLILPS